MMPAPSTGDQQSRGVDENACNTNQPTKTRRGELRAAALNKRESGQVTSEPNSPSLSRERQIFDSSSFGSPFKDLAENCGFKVIREDGAGRCECYSESDQSEATSVQTTPSCPSRWSMESCYDPEEVSHPKKVFKEFIVVSKRNDDALCPVNKSHPVTQQTYRVSRKSETATEPKVDYLDMADPDDTVETYHHDVPSRRNSCTESCISAGRSKTTPYTITRESRELSTKGDKSPVRYRIVRQDQCSTNKKAEVDVNVASNIWELGNQSAKLVPDKVRVPEEGEESRQHLSKPPSSKFKTKVYTRANQSSPLRLKDAHACEKMRRSDMSRDECKRSKGDAPLGVHVVKNADTGLKEKSVPEKSRRTSGPESENKLVTAHSKGPPQEQGNSQRKRTLLLKKRKEGGMVSRLRKLGVKLGMADMRNRDKENRERSRELHLRQFQCSNRHTLQCSSAGERVCHPFHVKSDRVSPVSRRHKLRRKETSTRTKLTSYVSLENGRRRLTDRGKVSATCRLPHQLSTSVAKKDIHPVPFRFDEYRNRDYNFNFNSEDECEDKICANSFIGHYLYELWKHQCLCDVRLKVGNTSFLAHKIVLAAFSDIFCPEDPQQIPALCFDIPDVTEEALCLILQYLYTSEMEITDSALEAVYTAASVLEINEIADLVAEILSKPTVENFEKYMTIRQNVGLPSSIMDFKDFVRDNLMDIANSAFVLNMPISDLEKLLRDPDLKVESEEDVMKLIIKWIEFNPCKRSKYSSELFTLVNFDCIGPESLSNIVEQNRHLLDMSSMEVIMRAFKSFALRNAEEPAKPEKFGCIVKSRKCRRKPQIFYRDQASSGQGPAIGRCKTFDPSEWEDSPSSDYVGRCCRDKENRSRITHVKSIQDIRDAARRHCWSKEKDLPGSSRNWDCCENNIRPGNSDTAAGNTEVTYTIRKKKHANDSCNILSSSGYREQRDRSESSESRCEQANMRPSSSRSDSDTGHPTCSSCRYKNHRKAVQNSRIAPDTGNLGDLNDRDVDESNSNLDVTEPPACSGSGTGRGPHKCHICQRSRSSSRSSGSSRRYNTSSSGSSKRVTFS